MVFAILSFDVARRCPHLAVYERMQEVALGDLDEGAWQIKKCELLRRSRALSHAVRSRESAQSVRA